MRNNKNGLDEMQRGRRNSIGSQMFMLMFYVLLIDSGLYGYGVRWLNYPANVMVIIMVCMSVYLVRLIAFNAYLPPKAQNKKTVITLIISIVFSITLTLASINLFGQPASQISENTNDNSALILFIVASVGLLSTLIVAVVKKVTNNKTDEDD
ncbi:MAG: hypothetical protein VB120_00515 [Lachnospiraceae bacterium]|nr:hypothetical protein [Lachnospiraceae bacterium]